MPNFMNQDFLKENNKMGVGILVGCQTVLEKNGYVSTGIITYAVGDIVEIEDAQYGNFNLGDRVKVTIYSPIGICFFITSIVAKDVNTLMILTPPDIQKKFGEKREYPRTETKNAGQLHSLIPPKLNLKRSLEQPLDILIENVSLGGIGFQGIIQLEHQHRADVTINIGEAVDCTVEVVRAVKDAESDTYHYGSRFVHFPENKMNTFRAFILRNQLQTRLQEKRRQSIPSN